MKKLNLLFTALLLMCYVGTAKAQHFEIDGIFYNITDSNSKTVEVTYKGSSYDSYLNEYTGSVVIPERVTYNGTTYSVTSIGYGAFYYCYGLTSITIPNSVTSIGEGTFASCSGLTSITIPNSVTSIGNSAFSNCSGLTSITIPNSVTSIGNSAFYNCDALTSITIPNSVTSIGNYAFYGCSGLTSITIPNSVTSIGNYAFYGCEGLKEVHINDIAAWCNINFDGSYANPLYYAHNLYLNNELITELVIPNGVTSIGYSAFNYCSGLTSITIPNSVTSIGSYAFEGCSGITSVTIGNSVTSIGNNVFYGCDGLITVINLSNLTFSKGSSNNGYIAYYANKVYNANNGSIEGDYIFCKPNNVNTLLFYLGNETELTLPADYKGESYVIGENVFKDNKTITSIEIPNSVTSIGNGAFDGCSKLTSVTIGNSVTSIGESAFEGCSELTSVTIPNSVTSIGNSAFYNCNGLTSVTIGNSVTSIGRNAFYGCKGLTSITIPNSVTSIGESAFSGCYGLKTVYNFSNLTFSKGSTNYGYIAYYANEVYNAPDGSIEGDYIFGKPNNVNTLVSYLGSETELTLPADYKGESYVIGENVFKDNKTITSIEIPNSVTSIGNGAFCNCTGLKEVHINDLVAWCGIDFGSADANPLYYAKNLFLNGELVTNLSIPAEVTEVKKYAFYNCKGVANIDIVDKVKSIGNSAFYGCSDLETLYISNTIENIDDYAFAECNNILDIKIGSKKSITASENIFSNDVYNNACLYVPEGRKFAYEKTSPWDNFYIQEIDYTGIEDINAENENVKAIYDLQGRRVENPTNGIYIINGKKTFVK